MNSSDPLGTKYRVICVCGGYGFPLGTASAARIIMVGKALREAEIGFRVLHCGPSPVAINKRRSGVHEGIPFEYTTCVARPENKLVRWLAYAWAAVGATIRLGRLWPVRSSTLVYLYVMDGVLNLYIGALCQLLGLPIAQELCEWVPDQPNPSPLFNRWLYRKRIFKVARGAVVISKAIERRVQERCATVNPNLLVHRLPVLVDTPRFAAVTPFVRNADKQVPNFLYCGTWLQDILFLIRSFALVKLQGHPCTLTIVGQCGKESDRTILDWAKEQLVRAEDIILAGCLDYRTLASWNKAAIALLMPLWNDDKSLTRLPNKLGEYLASGRPVITSEIGDLTDFLIDNVNAYVGSPDSERAFADKMIEVLQDPVRADRIGAAGQKACYAHLDYRVQSRGLAEFVVGCIECHNERRSTRKQHSQPRTVSRLFLGAEDIAKQRSLDNESN